MHTILLIKTVENFKFKLIGKKSESKHCIVKRKWISLKLISHFIGLSKQLNWK